MSVKAPVIGITTDYKNKYFGIEAAYSKAIASAGGLPLLIPSLDKSKKILKQIVDRIDGLLIPGSRDMDPKHYRQTPHIKLNPMDRKRTNSEFIILEESLKSGIPVMGICGGMQFINVFYGGSLYQDIKSLLPDAINHEQGAIHQISIKNNTLLRKIIKKSKINVKSYHHQAIKKVGKGLKISAISKDKIVESLETDDRQIIAVQWHPDLEQNEESKNLFKFIVDRASTIRSNL